MEDIEFREKLHAYTSCMDPSTFMNAFLDARKQHGDNLELILQDMAKAKIEYQDRIKAYKLGPK